VTGPDPRQTLARPDLADADLEWIVAAARYARPTAMRCAAPAAAVLREPAASAEQRDQLLCGEVFDVLEIAEGWAWGQARRDGYVGFVQLVDLAEQGAPPTHYVASLRAGLYAEPDLKARVLGRLSMNSLVQPQGQRWGDFVRAPDLAGWIPERSLAPIGRYADDPAAVASQFVGAAYVWGGREAGGLDCSGLVQQALFACGRTCPRDTDQQQALGAPVEPDALRRGDLVFWPGHVAMMLDAERIVHASGDHAAVVVEPLEATVQRREAAGKGRPTAHRRP
jgi:cell wall-associated NlpC family hydrolase